MTYRKIALALCIGLPAVALAGVQPAAVASQTAPAGALATLQQIEAERLELRILTSAPMREAIVRVEALYGADPQGATSVRRCAKVERSS